MGGLGQAEFGRIVSWEVKISKVRIVWCKKGVRLVWVHPSYSACPFVNWNFQSRTFVRQPRINTRRSWRPSIGWSWKGFSARRRRIPTASVWWWTLATRNWLTSWTWSCTDHGMDLRCLSGSCRPWSRTSWRRRAHIFAVPVISRKSSATGSWRRAVFSGWICANCWRKCRFGL